MVKRITSNDEILSSILSVGIIANFFCRFVLLNYCCQAANEHEDAFCCLYPYHFFFQTNSSLPEKQSEVFPIAPIVFYCVREAQLGQLFHQLHVSP